MAPGDRPARDGESPPGAPPGRVRERAALAGYTTLRLGGPARRLVEAATEAEIVAEVRAADASNEPLLVLGGGSNLVVADEGFPGTVVHVATRGVRRGVAGPGTGGHGQDPVELTVAAGEDWDAVVAGCVDEGLAGLECLSGIPGRAGATPIQNVGAYGQEVAERIIAVRVYDRDRGAVIDLAGADCGFGYRTSAFKRSLQAAAPAGPAPVTGRFVVLSMRFLLVRDRLSAPVRYAELARALGVADGDRAPLAAVRAAVLDLRRGKGMVLDPGDPDTRSVGSFFLNPVLDHAQFAAVERAAQAVAGPGARVPFFPAEDGRVKVPAAWLIEQAGFRKGYPAVGTGGGISGAGTSGARISFKHTLALVNPGEATAASLLALAREVREGVRATFGVELASEPVLVGTGL
jgi:UDP-N-acetylmuramate dehydrogenase